MSRANAEILKIVFTMTSRRLASAPQEIDSISPVPIPSFSCQSGQGPDQTADIRGRNCFFVHKNHAAVRSLFCRPGFEQGRNRPAVISNKRESLGGGVSQTRGVLLSQETPIFPFHHIGTSIARWRRRGPFATSGEMCSSRRTLSRSEEH